MNKENKLKKELYEFSEKDIKRAYRPIRATGCFFMIISICIVIGMIAGSFLIDVSIGVFKALPLLLIMIFPALFYFSGLRSFCYGLDYEKGFVMYKKCAKISFIIMLVIIAVILTVFLLRTFISDGIGSLDI